MSRETCQVWVGGLEDYRQCDAPAVDYYITTELKKFWLCAFHWDIHARAIAACLAEGQKVTKQSPCGS